jgi:acetamidase/formamidase
MYGMDTHTLRIEQAYAIPSHAVDLKVSEMADVPNFVVPALLPLGILTG